jgi:hypothetical protein
MNWIKFYSSMPARNSIDIGYLVTSNRLAHPWAGPASGQRQLRRCQLIEQESAGSAPLNYIYISEYLYQTTYRT